jgi:hypothetical protein
VAQTLGYYPLANIALTGYASTGEANAETPKSTVEIQMTGNE